MKKIIILIVLLNFLTGCSTLNKKTIIAGATGFVVCSAIGAISAPSDEKKEFHGAMWGGLCSSAAMLTNEVLEGNKEKKKVAEMLKQYRGTELKDELILKESLLSSPEIKNIDPRIREKLNGNWSIYKIDNWILDGGKIKHEDMEIEFK